MTRLESGAVILRAWCAEDQANLIQYANNHKIAKWLRDRFPHPYTEAHARHWIGVANEANPLTNFAIEVDHHAVGGIGLMLGDDIFRCSAEIGYWLGEPFWGRGITPIAIKLLTDYGFKTFDLARILAGVFEENAASARVLEKAGYVLESRQRKSVIKDGRVGDQLLYVSVR